MTKLSAFGFTLFLTCMYGVANAQSDTLQVTDFTLEEQNITLKIGESRQLHVNPANAEVIWMESWGLAYDPVSIVDNNGLVTALRAGNSIVHVENKGASVMRYCQVTVADEGSVRKDKKSFDPTDECEWKDVSFSLTNDGTFIVDGTYYGSGAQTNYLNYIVTDQCIFLWFEINYEDSTKMFYPQPFSLELKDCNAGEYNIYLNNRTHVLQSQDGFVKYAIRRGSSTISGQGTGTINIKNTVVSKVNESYYDMLGRCVETPSGLTIVVTRYSDGSVHTEKKLFR